MAQTFPVKTLPISKFKQKSITIFQTSSLFTIIFLIVQYIIVPIKAIILDVGDSIAFTLDILLGISFLVIFIMIFLSAHTRFGAFMQIFQLVFWSYGPWQTMIDDWDRMHYNFLGVFLILSALMIISAFITILGWINLMMDTLHLKKGYEIDKNPEIGLENELEYAEGKGLRKTSVFWGPWFQNFTEFFQKKSWKPQNRTKMKRGLKILSILIFLIIPGLLPFLNVYKFKVEIVPKDYDIKFNFWATPDLNGNYSEGIQNTHNIGPQIYNASIRNELNEHKVNLDLTINRVTNSTVGLLKQWETALPNITYRITIYPSNGLWELPHLVRNATEIMLASELNKTLDQWRGFVFDIEGAGYDYQTCFETYDEAVNMWNDIFNYIDQKSAIRGTPIEMVSVHYAKPVSDVKFDGDIDMQKERMSPSYYPERFTSYEPMMYRCQFEGAPPYSPYTEKDVNRHTAYELYSSILTLSKSLPQEKLGAYIGVTNLSCYGNGVPQYEETPWGVSSGLNNLMVDVLTCKHFKIKEVTFFLLWTVLENDYYMGGVFDSYGMDFLDVVNETVNTNPPKNYYIKFNYNDAIDAETERHDWVLDLSTYIGILQIILIAGITAILMKKMNSRQKASK
jgi:hypothetical protein